MKKWIGLSAWAFILAGFVQAQQMKTVKLTASEGSKADELGNAVAIEGGRIFVGAHRDRPSGSYSGSAYIFQFDGEKWREAQKLIAGDVSSYAQFGWDVALSSSYALIGACGDRHAGKEAGAAYFFEHDGGQWRELQKVTKADAERDDLFGVSVAVDKNVAVVGAEGDDNGLGSAYVYERKAGGSKWLEIAELRASDGESGDLFGADVDISGDYIVVGAPERDEKGKRSGAVYIFQKENQKWVERTKLLAEDAAAEDEFGVSLAIEGQQLVVGAHLNDEKGADAGAAYVFQNEGSGWKQKAKLTSKDAESGDQFGCSVSISGDHLAVAAFKDDDNGPDAGSAYRFNKVGENWVEDQKLLPDDGGENDAFGSSAAIEGERVAVGAWLEDVGAENTGAAYVFEPATTVSVRENAPAPNAFELEQNYPNPFNPTTVIRYKLLNTAEVDLAVFNHMGQKVRTLVRERQYPGVYQVRWNGLAGSGERLPSGQYAYRLRLGDFVQTRKMIFLK